MNTPETERQPSFAHAYAYAVLTAAAHTNRQWENFAPYILSLRSAGDDIEVAHAAAEEQKLQRRLNALQNRSTKNPDDIHLKRRFETASEDLKGQQSIVSTVKQNRSIELEAIANEVTDCLLQHNYANAVRIPHHAVTSLGERNGVRYVAFLVHPADVDRLKDDPCLKGHTLTHVMTPQMT